MFCFTLFFFNVVKYVNKLCLWTRWETPLWHFFLYFSAFDGAVSVYGLLSVSLPVHFFLPNLAPTWGLARLESTWWKESFTTEWFIFSNLFSSVFWQKHQIKTSAFSKAWARSSIKFEIAIAIPIFFLVKSKDFFSYFLLLPDKIVSLILHSLQCNLSYAYFIS